MYQPNWLNNESNKKRSQKQEKRFAKEVKGRLTAGSGAVFKQNDVKTKDFSFELKITKYKQFTLKLADLKKAFARAEGRIPVFVIEFGDGTQVAVLNMIDFKTLTNGKERQR